MADTYTVPYDEHEQLDRWTSDLLSISDRHTLNGAYASYCMAITHEHFRAGVFSDHAVTRDLWRLSGALAARRLELQALRG